MGFKRHGRPPFPHDSQLTHRCIAANRRYLTVDQFMGLIQLRVVSVAARDPLRRRRVWRARAPRPAVEPGADLHGRCGAQRPVLRTAIEGMVCCPVVGKRDDDQFIRQKLFNAGAVFFHEPRLQ